MNDTRPVLALSGGVGGAKLALGLLKTLPPGTLSVAANTGDDFEHFGLSICPDIDTLLYTLSGEDDLERGWGRRNESWQLMQTLEQLGGETWFRLGDRDLALHLERTQQLRKGRTLTEVTAHLAAKLGIHAALIPMSDRPVQTRLNTDEGWLEFQPWFVGRQARPAVKEIAFEGAEQSRMPDALRRLLEDDSLRAILICPSNPLISIGPILRVPDLRAALGRARAPIVAVSPLINGRAVKGPTDKMMRELGMQADVLAIAKFYEGLIDGLVIDEGDSAYINQLRPLACSATPILMVSHEDRVRVAQAALDLADRIAGARP